MSQTSRYRRRACDRKAVTLMIAASARCQLTPSTCASNTEPAATQARQASIRRESRSRARHGSASERFLTVSARVLLAARKLKKARGAEWRVARRQRPGSAWTHCREAQRGHELLAEPKRPSPHAVIATRTATATPRPSASGSTLRNAHQIVTALALAARDSPDARLLIARTRALARSARP